MNEEHVIPMVQLRHMGGVPMPDPQHFPGPACSCQPIPFQVFATVQQPYVRWVHQDTPAASPP